jgi:hypothetical protein
MRQRFVQVLRSDDKDDATTYVLRRFWSRAEPLPVRSERRPEARVVDLTSWARSRRDPAF